MIIDMPFVKGHVGFNKGLKLKGEWRNCLKCGVESWYNKARIDNGGGKYCSRKCRAQHHIQLFSGNGKHFNFKGDKVGYYGIHDWFTDHLPKPKSCIKCGKFGKVNKGGKWNIQRALIHGKKYERKLENFISLCQQCHMEYDGTLIKLQKPR